MIISDNFNVRWIRAKKARMSSHTSAHKNKAEIPRGHSPRRPTFCVHFREQNNLYNIQKSNFIVKPKIVIYPWRPFEPSSNIKVRMRGIEEEESECLKTRKFFSVWGAKPDTIVRLLTRGGWGLGCKGPPRISFFVCTYSIKKSNEKGRREEANSDFVLLSCPHSSAVQRCDP